MKIMPIAALAVLSTCAPAAAQGPVCGDRIAVAEELAVDWGETVLGHAPMIMGGHFELWLPPDTGTWTILIISPDGRTACIALLGEGWDYGAPKPAAH